MVMYVSTHIFKSQRQGSKFLDTEIFRPLFQLDSAPFKKGGGEFPAAFPVQYTRT
jgi:hypothetical protein